jgi:hypothetical protein
LEFSALNKINEPTLTFDVSKNSPVNVHPLIGLKEFGPYSASIFPINRIRIASIHLKGTGHVVSNLINEFELTHHPKERLRYLPDYKGFGNIFKSKIDFVNNVSIELNPDEMFSVDQPRHISLANVLGNAVRTMAQRLQDFDVLLIYLPKSWEDSYIDEDSNFDMHDYLKAITAIRNIPTQIVTEGGAINYKCRCSVMWRLSIALYVKAGGIPWKLSSLDHDSAFIGLSYSSRLNPHTNQFDFTTCCSQVFDSDGTGLEFIAYDTNGIESRVGENPFLTREEMRKLMSKSLSLYQKRHAGRLPKRLIIHKTTHFKSQEIDGAFDAVSSNVGLELLQIIQDTPWKGIKYDKYKNWEVKGFPIERGSYFQSDSQEILLWTQGNVPLNGKGFYKEGKGIPSPISIKRFAGYGGWDQNCQAVMGLTKMNWNHDGLYDRLPVTLGFASVLARTVKRMDELVNKPYEFRYFM